jgi:tRNA A-37 threonylcarbamoyl transferase component Bud32
VAKLTITIGTAKLEVVGSNPQTAAADLINRHFKPLAPDKKPLVQTELAKEIADLVGLKDRFAGFPRMEYAVSLPAKWSAHVANLAVGGAAQPVAGKRHAYDGGPIAPSATDVDALLNGKKMPEEIKAQNVWVKTRTTEYQIVRKFATKAGSQGTPYVLEAGPERHCVMKTVRGGQEAALRMERDALAKFQACEGVVRLLDDAGPLVLLEMGKGDILSRKWKASPADLKAKFRPIVEALRTMHDAGVWHNDLQASNVVVFQVGDTEVLKLIDIGGEKVVPGGFKQNVQELAGIMIECLDGNHTPLLKSLLSDAQEGKIETMGQLLEHAFWAP